MFMEATSKRRRAPALKKAFGEFARRPSTPRWFVLIAQFVGTETRYEIETDVFGGIVTFTSDVRELRFSDRKYQSMPLFNACYSE